MSTKPSATTKAADAEAAQQWEGEGGATAPVTPQVPTTTPPAPPRTDVEKGDDRQDEYMKVHSVEGQPPTAHTRRVEWWFVGVIAALIVGGGITWLIFAKVPLAVVGVGIVLGAFLILGTNPVLWASLYRARDQRDAKRATKPPEPAPADR